MRTVPVFHPGSGFALVLCCLALLDGPRALANPLGPARISELHGQALRAPPAWLPVKLGDLIADGEGLHTAEAPGTRLELTFPDGSLLRLGPGTALTLRGAERRVDLSMGRLLVQADRMIGGVQVMTPTVACFPEGTTYLVAVYADRTTEVEVLEGAVQVTRPTLTREALVLPGEALRIIAVAAPSPARPTTYDILRALQKEPLLIDFARELASRERIEDLGDQQRRRVLAGRNQRLRREIHWKRPRHEIVLPELFQPRQPRQPRQSGQGDDAGKERRGEERSDGRAAGG